ncbi:hypothetical protein [Bradyrhizobium sp.]|uniref:hypothetical protein n=1 Tax=Bradyrhizobium sp. TaxID=376 RepID=UPI00261FC96E|nr:hypothetical protein [Bradyrhizobium sp.]
MKDGAIAHRESRTFSNRVMAKTSGKKRETVLAKPGGFEAAKELLADAIDTYPSTSKKQIRRTKAQVLETIKEMDIAKKRCSEIVAQDIVALAQELYDGGRQPSTVINCVSHLQVVFTAAKPAWWVRLRSAGHGRSAGRLQAPRTDKQVQTAGAPPYPRAAR